MTKPNHEEPSGEKTRVRWLAAWPAIPPTRSRPKATEHSPILIAAKHSCQKVTKKRQLSQMEMWAIFHIHKHCSSIILHHIACIAYIYKYIYCILINLKQLLEASHVKGIMGFDCLTVKFCQVRAEDMSHQFCSATKQLFKYAKSLSSQFALPFVPYLHGCLF